MRTRQRATIQELRTAIECLPRSTRVAMLEGIRSNDIIAGAYTDAAGICPMLAAHRAGGRTNLISFARAWDAFAFRDARTRRARRATERELLILRSHLEASLVADEGPAPDLGEALAEHRELIARRRERQVPRHETATAAKVRRPRPGDADRSRELGKRQGWAWLRAFRRYDEYERALAHVDALGAPGREAAGPSLREAEPIA